MIRWAAPDWLWAALLVLTPLAYNPVSRWQYEPDKAALVLALTGLLIAVSQQRSAVSRQPSAISGQPSAVSGRRSAGSRHRLGAATLLVAYGWLRWFTTARSIMPAWSLWGDPAWGNGLWLTLAGVALFALARRWFVTPERRARAMAALLMASSLVAAYGLLQYAGLDPLTPPPVFRAFSTLAHANLLAAYLAMTLPLTVARLLNYSSPIDTPDGGRVFPHAPFRLLPSAFSLALQLACLVVTYSRAGWLAALTGLAVTLIAWAWSAGRRRLALSALAVSGVGLALLFGLSRLPPLPESAPHPLQTLTSLFRWTGATAQIRLLGWRAGLEAWRARPLLGYGPATSRPVLEWFARPELAPFGGPPALGGRPHNVYLEIALESGGIGLALFLGLLAALLIPLLRALPQGDAATRALRAGILGALSANLVTYFFSFESAAPLVLFWSLAGMGSVLSAPVAPVRPRPAARRGPAAVAPWLAAMVGLGCAIGLELPALLAFAGERAVAQRRWAEATAYFRQAGDLAFTPETFRLLEGWAYAEWAAEARDPALWARGAAIYAALTASQPAVAEYRQAQGTYLRRWDLADPHAHTALPAVAIFSAALERSPRQPDLWLDRGLARLQAGDPEGALADIEQAGALCPGYVRYYGARALHAQSVGDLEAALRWQQEALAAQRAWEAWSWRR